MQNSEHRIHFADNPWPEGHALEEFEWRARLVDGDLWFDLHLVTRKYYAERDIEDDDSIEYASDWNAPIVWGNYHNCILSSTYWGGDGGFRVCVADAFSPAWLNGRTFEVDRFDQDPLADEIENLEERPFGLYLLGHDSAVDHRIRFLRVGDSDRFDIEWTGRIAQSYVGDYVPRHTFRARMYAVPCPISSVPEIPA